MYIKNTVLPPKNKILFVVYENLNYLKTKTTLLLLCLKKKFTYDM